MKTSLDEIPVTGKHIVNTPFLHDENGDTIREAP